MKLSKDNLNRTNRAPFDLTVLCYRIREEVAVTRSGTVTAPEDSKMGGEDQRNSGEENEAVVKAGGKSTATPSTTDPSSRFAAHKVFYTRPESQIKAPNAAHAKEDEPPPFIVPSPADPDTTKAFLKTKLVAGDYVVKNLINGIQIHVHNYATHAKLKLLLEENNFQFYTYNRNEIQLVKFVLYGLNEEEPGDILYDLKSYGLIPADIKKMRILRPKYKDHTNYIIYFDASDHITLPLLKRVKYICNTVINWAHYRAPQSNCTQCRNCFRFNHTAATCNMAARCLICASNHKVVDCQLMIEKIKLNSKSIPNHLLKCANCQGQHTAAFANCPARLNYLTKKMNKGKPDHAERRPIIDHAERRPITDHAERRPITFTDAPRPLTNAWETRSKHTPQTNSLHQDQQQPILIQSNSPPRRTITSTNVRMFNPSTPVTTRGINKPAATRPHRQPTKQKQGQTPAKPAQRSTQPQQNTADYVNCPSTVPINNSKIANTPIQQNNNQFVFSNNSRVDLFTAEEMVSIFQEMVGSIVVCKSKSDQLSVLMKIAMKWTPCMV